MSRRVVKRWEAEVLMRGIETARYYMNRLVDRMYQQAFDRDDPVFQAALVARDALGTLWGGLHYRSCQMAPGPILTWTGSTTRRFLLAALWTS